jgi:hypothetical protein
MAPDLTALRADGAPPAGPRTQSSLKGSDPKKLLPGSASILVFHMVQVDGFLAAAGTCRAGARCIGCIEDQSEEETGMLTTLTAHVLTILFSTSPSVSGLGPRGSTSRRLEKGETQ